MKKVIIIMLSFLLPTIVSAKTITNKNNVQMEEDTYNKLCEIFPKEFVEELDDARYNSIMENNLTDVEIVTSNPISLMSTIIDNTYKTLSIVKVGSLVTIKLEWKKEPKYHSYDVIGYRLSGNITASNQYFQQIYNGSNVSTDNYYLNYPNGYGASFKLQNGLAKVIILSFRYTGTGTVYASYQHATANVTLATSKDYSISSAGYGSVFNFSNYAKQYYDNMAGVYIGI